MTLRPPPTRRHVTGNIVGSLTALVGRPLTGIVYAMPAGATWRPEPTNPHVHEVEMAVVLKFGGPHLRLDWAQSGWEEGMALQFDISLPDAWSATEVQTEANWAPLIKRPLIGADVAWHRSEEGASEVALGMIFRFEGEVSVTIGLGEWVDGSPSYLPDEIIVLFERGAGARYFDSLGTEWLCISGG